MPSRNSHNNIEVIRLDNFKSIQVDFFKILTKSNSNFEFYKNGQLITECDSNLTNRAFELNMTFFLYMTYSRKVCQFLFQNSRIKYVKIER
jgi:hypothetical protein